MTILLAVTLAFAVFHALTYRTIYEICPFLLRNRHLLTVILLFVTFGLFAPSRSVWIRIVACVLFLEVVMLDYYAGDIEFIDLRRGRVIGGEFIGGCPIPGEKYTLFAKAGGESIAYTGYFSQDGYANGEGRLETDTRFTSMTPYSYTGNWKSGLRHGTGRYVERSGNREVFEAYEGGWVRGMEHGRGTRWRSGRKIMGDFRYGRLRKVLVEEPWNGTDPFHSGV